MLKMTKFNALRVQAEHKYTDWNTHPRRKRALKSALRGAAAVLVTGLLAISPRPAQLQYNPVIPLSDIVPTQAMSRIQGLASDIGEKGNSATTLEKILKPQRLFIPGPKVTKKALKVLLSEYNWSTDLWNGASWWQDPNILITVMEYSTMMHTKTYLRYANATFNKYKSGHFLDEYYDDEGWWANAWLMAYKMTKNPKFLHMAQYIAHDMEEGYGTGGCGGGIPWDKSHTYDNAIPNLLFMNITLGLYEILPRDKGYFNWATRDYKWFIESGMLNHSYLVNDGLTSSCTNNGGSVWTYNQGEFIGALVKFAKVTGKAKYLYLAELVANATDIADTNRHGIMYEISCAINEDCNTGSFQFKSIYMDNLDSLYNATKNVTYGAFIARNADSIWLHDRSDYTFGYDWAGPMSSANSVTQAGALESVLFCDMLPLKRT